MRGKAPVLVLLAVLILAGCVSPAATKLDVGAAATASPFTNTAVFNGSYSMKDKLSHPLDPGSLKIQAPLLQKLKSAKDGEDVLIGYALPDVPAGTKVPVIVLASPYFFGGVAPAGFAKDGNFKRLAENFVPHGYAVAFIPVRGTADTGGCMDLMGPLERADLDSAITWLGEQPWSNGNVGMVGVSYDGSTPWEVAGTGNAHLKTIVPISGVNDIYTLMYGSGRPEVRGLAVLNALYYLYGFNDYNAAKGTRSPEHMAKGAACPESLKGLGVSVATEFTGERDATGFWAARNSRPLVEQNYKGSIFLVHGLQDWNVDPHEDFPWVPTLESKGLVVKYLLSQTDHAWPDSMRNDVEKNGARVDWSEMLLHWFDHWLKDDATVDLGPQVEVQDSQGAWRTETSWPPQDAVATPLYMGGGKLVATPDAPQGSALIGVSRGPIGILEGSPGDCAVGCATFTSEAFTKETRFAGLPHVRVNVTPLGPAGMLSAWVYSEKDGKRTLVGWGAGDLRFPKGGEKATPVVPGQKMAVDFPLEPLDVVVPAGAKLVVQLHEDGFSDHPAFEPAPMRVELGGASSLVDLPVIERDGSTTFQAPKA